MRALHDWTTWLWIPLGSLHVLALLLDKTAQIGLADLVLPFRVEYGSLAIGLGTLSLDLLVVITVTSWLRRRMKDEPWRWIYRTSFLMFVLLFVHASLSGADLHSPLHSLVTWFCADGRLYAHYH